MIEKDGFGQYDLICDNCGESADKSFDDFYDAVNYRKDKDNGWTSKKYANGWKDLCPECSGT
jgi:hypothetical protein